MKDLYFHFFKIKELIIAIRISKLKAFAILMPYYALTVFNAFLEGVGMVILVGFFTGGALAEDKNGLMIYVEKIVKFFGANSGITTLLPLLIFVFLLNFIIRFSLLVFDGALASVLRRKLQEEVFRRYLMGSWAHMRSFRVGDAVGTNTQEAVTISKYITSAISAVYFFLSAGVLSSLALFTSFKIAFALGLIAFPIMILMQKTFVIQSKLSRESAVLRNDFSSNITDRFNGLLQIHVDNNYPFHLGQGLRTQAPLIEYDYKIGVCQALIGSFNILLPLCALIAFFTWRIFTENQAMPDMSLVASVGILGLRFASQMNGVVSSIGNLSRLSGSLYPVLGALNIPSIPTREKVSEPIDSVSVEGVSYSFDSGKKIIDCMSLTLKKNSPLILSGRSGKGKTTLANLVAGLYFPDSGKVNYITTSGGKYDSLLYCAKVGFVTQDIYLFNDTLRNNLSSGRLYSDEAIWDVLRQVDAVDFVEKMGGLDAESVEAGRSLSGGQRRRLGIARVLLLGSEILIFDEVTAGLDTKNKEAVLGVIQKLSAHYIVIVISHDEITLPNQVLYSI